MSGSGSLVGVRIYGPENETTRSHFDKNNLIWEIQPDGGATCETAVHVEELQYIVYGVVPTGFRQVIPKNRQPPQLLPERRYRFHFETVNAPHGTGHFVILDSRAVIVAGPRRCSQEQDGKWVAINCPESHARIVSAIDKSKCIEEMENEYGAISTKYIRCPEPEI
jgi:hypothetical protein